ncbi:hypothetical protein QYM36_019733, partial [Artemia franciscana]
RSSTICLLVLFFFFIWPTLSVGYPEIVQEKTLERDTEQLGEGSSAICLLVLFLFFIWPTLSVGYPEIVQEKTLERDTETLGEPRAGMTNYIQASSGSDNIQSQDQIAIVSLSLEAEDSPAEEVWQKSSKENDAEKASQLDPKSE